jgi:hypothetical protein
MGRRQNNPSIGWVHPKSTHGRPLTWGSKEIQWFQYRLTCHPNTLLKKTNKQTYELEERSYYITPDPPAAQFGKDLCRDWNIRSN